MNTVRLQQCLGTENPAYDSQVRSVGYGWGVLIVAGAGSYYFAKRSINSDRAERAMAEEKRRQTQQRLRAQETVSRDISMSPTIGSKKKSPDHLSPSRELEGDPAPVTHANESKYEAPVPFRSRKGDRFS